MAQVTLTIGDRRHTVACRDGDEPRLEALGAMLDSRWASAQAAAGGGGERAMLFVALMLADALDEAGSAPDPVPAAPAADDALLDRVAERLETLADALEQGAPTS